MESLVPEQLYFLLHLSNLLAREQASSIYKDCRKQENQRSNPAVTSPGPNTNPLYKTELCRSWEESGGCRYGSKCQFAHGPEDLRPAQRHPKYKTETCHMFATTGTCAYGARCRFLHKRATKRGEGKESRCPAGGGNGSGPVGAALDWPQQPTVHAPPSSPMPSSPAIQAPPYSQHPFAASLPATPSLPYLHSLAAQAVLHKGPTSPTTVLDCPGPGSPEWPPLQGSTEHGGLRAGLKLAPLSLAVLDSFGPPASPSTPAHQFLARNTTPSAMPRCADDSFAPLPPTLGAADALRPYCSSDSLCTSQQGGDNAAPAGSDRAATRALLSLASPKPCAGSGLVPLSRQCSGLESARRLPIFKCLAIDSSEQRP